MKTPNPKNHFLMSMVKSGLRILAGFHLISGNVEIAGFVLILAEVLGILEEMV